MTSNAATRSLDSKPVVSVVMPIFNAGRHLAASIDSVVEQSMGEWELLLVDDFSTDNSAQIAQQYTDPRIRLLRHQANQGVSEARNTALRAACGKYIVFLDSDDIAHRNRFLDQVKVLDGQPSLGAVGSWAELIDDAGAMIGTRCVPFRDELLRPVMIFLNPVITSSLMVRREAVPESGFKAMLSEDYDFLTRIDREWGLSIIPHCLVRYRISPHGLSAKQREKMKAGSWMTQQRLLLELGIPADKIDRDIHCRIANSPAEGINTKQTLAAEGWLRTIIAANETSGNHDPELLREAIQEILLSLWRSAAKDGLRAVAAAHKSLSGFGHSPSFSQLSRLAARALLKRA